MGSSECHVDRLRLSLWCWLPPAVGLCRGTDRLSRRTLTFNFTSSADRRFTIADPQNWIGSFSFLATALIASRLSAEARRRALEAVTRQQDLERLYSFQPGNPADRRFGTVSKSPDPAGAETFELSAAVLYDRRTEKFYRRGPADFEGPHGQLPRRGPAGQLVLGRGARSRDHRVRWLGAMRRLDFLDLPWHLFCFRVVSMAVAIKGCFLFPARFWDPSRVSATSNSDIRNDPEAPADPRTRILRPNRTGELMSAPPTTLNAVRMVPRPRHHVQRHKSIIRPLGSWSSIWMWLPLCGRCLLTLWFCFRARSSDRRLVFRQNDSRPLRIHPGRARHADAGSRKILPACASYALTPRNKPKPRLRRAQPRIRLAQHQAHPHWSMFHASLRRSSATTF